MPNLGISELIVILMILLLVFGGSRLPQIGESLGRTARSFKRGFASDDGIKVEEAEAAPKHHSADAQLKAPVDRVGSEREISEAELVDKKS